ncbi:transmembrane and immunoglobulin domain-containing protein 2-like [Polyodon spathula]|uniref:transmembrane and immunoglobulin domain-containing protein 2-like n=1 Tax=Polyodon spathula TaxID=7913 RepID=UPI001B7EF2E4|nr:transmembrane and immunoglobulin domain-containing protein 2-like [Polyodon spathula]
MFAHHSLKMNKPTTLQGYIFLALWYSIGAKAEINITQSPLEITAVEGESVQMNCSWKKYQSAQQIRVEWWKNQSRIISLFYTQNNSDMKGNNASFTVLLKANNTATELRIAKLTQNHAGTYHCRAVAEIPTLEKGNGSGTVLYVREVQNDSSLGSGAAVGVVLAVLFVLLIITLLWKLKITRAQDQGDAAVYESVSEMDAVEEPQEDVEANSSSTQGSTKWAEIPVYESCDYFDVKSNENEDER